MECGGLPWVALALTVTWGFYAFFRKTLPIGPTQGFLLEVLLLTPPALAFIIYLTVTGPDISSQELPPTRGSWQQAASLLPSR